MPYTSKMADIKNTFLISSLLQKVSHEQPLDLALLAEHGVSPALAAHYARSGWLERLGTGVYRFSGARLDRDQCLLFLQRKLPGLHVGGKTALAWQGIRHYLSPTDELSLWGDRHEALPAWFVSEFPSSYRSWALFNPSTVSKGLFTPPDVNPGVLVSVRERAVLELLRDVRTSSDLEEARHLFFATQGLRLPVMGQLLEECKSVKTVRLFLLWAKQAENIDLSQLRRDFTLPTGSSLRWIGKLPDGTKLVLPA
jgi:hypothetical protein